MGTKLFFGNLPDDCTPGDIEKILMETKWSDDVVRSCEINLVRDRTTDKFKGFAYVDVKSEERAQELLQLDGANFDNKRLRIHLATPKNNVKIGARGDHHGSGGSRGGDFGRGGRGGRDSNRGGGHFGRSGDFGREEGSWRGGFRDKRDSNRSGRRNSGRKEHSDEEKNDSDVSREAPPKPAERPRLQLTKLTTDPAELEAKKKREAEAEAARREKIFKA